VTVPNHYSTFKQLWRKTTSHSSYETDLAHGNGSPTMQDYCFVSLYMKNGLKQVENAESRLSIVKVEHMH